MRQKHVQKIKVSDEHSVMISDINIRDKEIEYYIMNENVIIKPKSRVSFELKDDMVEFNEIKLNVQYLVKLLNERGNTLHDINTMLKLKSLNEIT